MGANGPRVVVGVDGSPGSRAALRWALRYVEKCGGRVTAVMAWRQPLLTESAPVLPAVPDEASKALAERELRKTVDETKSLLATSVAVVCDSVRGHAARALLDSARSADLLVVGSRGHGGFVGALLGSVSQHCVSHANCPVVVVRPAEK